MTFASPLALLLGLLAAVAAALLHAHAARRRRAALALFGGNHAEADRAARRHALRAALLVAAVALLGVAAGGPRLGTETRELPRTGLDLVVVFDVSRSMLAEDVAPSRLLRARAEVGRVLEALPGARVGLVLFAGDASVAVPLTTDRAAVRQALDAAHPDAFAPQGTNLGRALEVALDALAAAPDDQGTRARAVLVVSDGEDHAGRLRGPLRAAEATGVALFAAGVGTRTGATIPRADGALHTDRDGRPVTTRLEPEPLRRIARSGAYLPLTAPGENLSELPRLLVRNGLAAATESVPVPIERYAWPLALALLLLAAERLIPTTRRRPTRQPAAT